MYAFDTYYAGISFYHHQKSEKNPHDFYCLGIILASPFSPKTIVPTIREFKERYLSNEFVSFHLEGVLDISRDELLFYLEKKYIGKNQDQTCVKLEDFFDVYRGEEKRIKFEDYKKKLTRKMFEKDLYQYKSRREFQKTDFVIKKNLSTYSLLYNDWRENKVSWFDLYQVKDVDHYFYLVQRFLIFYKYVRHRHPVKDVDKELSQILKDEKLFSESSNNKEINLEQNFGVVLRKVEEYVKNKDEKNKVKVNLAHVKRLIQFKFLSKQYKRNYKRVSLDEETFDYSVLKKPFFNKEFQQQLHNKRKENIKMAHFMEESYSKERKKCGVVENFWEVEELFKKNQPYFSPPKATKVVQHTFKLYDQYFTEQLASKIMHLITIPKVKMLIPMDRSKRKVYKGGHFVNGVINIALLAFQYTSTIESGFGGLIFNLLSPMSEFIFSLSESYTFRESKKNALIRGSIRYIIATLWNFVPFVQDVNQLFDGLDDIRVGLQFNQKLKKVISGRNTSVKYSCGMLGDPMVLLILRERLIYLQKGLFAQGLFLYRNLDLSYKLRQKLSSTLLTLLEEEKLLIKYLQKAKMEYELMLFRGKVCDALLSDVVFFLFNEYHYKKFSDRIELDEYHIVNQLEKELRR